ncbi:hypothetical protein IU500_35795 [Nocardia terpenica]|uniref:Uncharacterized protein n=1 Tax=Nocardia terpenica TaxID=455432 RepID=A0A164P8L8_9NOCA|nr:hypothetical protein [Nocardia terpenica]KZM75257.1 hypothetical protein AWN90_17765 [Nocardia terpenica]MBF6063611.1 hypothetical protein [Nocardia terpenica]MBF6109380.1 hypothetical protein [Nocardia terpenica]MBF6114160.1 hypothetical protein [Nocardia terpenica]MBF6123830.1 hypothetical protein [Nocardia terpenica]
MDPVVSPIASLPPANDSLPPHRFFEPVPELTGRNAAAFAYNSDRLVRHLFEISLSLYPLRAELHRTDATVAEIRAAGDALAGLLDSLDTVIRDTGLAMLALALETGGADPEIDRQAS